MRGRPDLLSFCPARVHIPAVSIANSSHSETLKQRRVLTSAEKVSPRTQEVQVRSDVDDGSIATAVPGGQLVCEAQNSASIWCWWWGGGGVDWGERCLCLRSMPRQPNTRRTRESEPHVHPQPPPPPTFVENVPSSQGLQTFPVRSRNVRNVPRWRCNMHVSQRRGCRP